MWLCCHVTRAIAAAVHPELWPRCETSRGSERRERRPLLVRGRSPGPFESTPPWAVPPIRCTAAAGVRREYGRFLSAAPQLNMRGRIGHNSYLVSHTRYDLTYTPLYSHVYTIILSHIYHYTLTYIPLYSHIYTIILSHIHHYTHTYTLLYSCT